MRLKLQTHTFKFLAFVLNSKLLWVISLYYLLLSLILHFNYFFYFSIVFFYLVFYSHKLCVIALLYSVFISSVCELMFFPLITNFLLLILSCPHTPNPHVVISDQSSFSPCSSNQPVTGCCYLNIIFCWSVFETQYGTTHHLPITTMTTIKAQWHSTESYHQLPAGFTPLSASYSISYHYIWNLSFNYQSVS